MLSRLFSNALGERCMCFGGGQICYDRNPETDKNTNTTEQPRHRPSYNVDQWLRHSKARFGKLSTQTSHRDNYRERLLEVIGLRRSSLLLGRAWLRYRLQAAFQSKEFALFLLNFTSKTFQIGPLDIIAQGGRGCHFLEQGGFATVNDTSRTLRLS